MKYNPMKILILPLILAASATAHASDCCATPVAATADTMPASYPLTTCVVSGEKLGEHGKPVKVTADGTDVWLCCKSCKKDFEKDSAKYVKMVKDAPTEK
jgi:YHS domain-containing protein